jgi:hypothetical protein
MPGRTPFFFALLAAAIGLPYISSGGRQSPPVGEGTAQPAAAAPATLEPAAAIASAPALLPPLPEPATVASLSTPKIPIPEALNLQATTDWVMRRWPRVTTGLADADLQGYRVPWISGTALDDVAGSLTYYFTPQRQLDRITFRGTTGDPRRLVSLLTSRFAFRRQNSSDASVQLYQVRWNGRPRSELEIRTIGIVRTDAASERFQLALTIRSPNAR